MLGNFEGDPFAHNIVAEMLTARDELVFAEEYIAAREEEQEQKPEQKRKRKRKRRQEQPTDSADAPASQVKEEL